MQKYLHLPWSSSGSRLIALASGALLLSAALQLATAWMQLQTRRALLEYQSQLQHCSTSGISIGGSEGAVLDVPEGEEDWENAYCAYRLTLLTSLC